MLSLFMPIYFWNYPFSRPSYSLYHIHSFIHFQGTQSLNPHNDYCQHFVDTGHRPQNFIRDVGECVLAWAWFSSTCAGLCVAMTSLSSVVQAWPTDLKNTRNFESWSDWRTNSSPPPTPLPCMLNDDVNAGVIICMIGWWDYTHRK